MTAFLSFDVIVVGAGMVGQSAALGFALSGLSVALVEATPILEMTFPEADTAFELKVVALSRASENFFQYLGVWSQMSAARHCAYQHMVVWDSVLDGLIEFWAHDYFEPNLGYIIEQRIIMAALTEKIRQSKYITTMIDTPIKMQEDEQGHRVLLLKSGLELKSPLVIGADGAHSALRQLANISIKETDYHQQAIVAVVESEIPHQSTAFQRFASDGPLALLPLSHPKQCSIVWTTSPSNSQILCEMSEFDFAQKLTRETNSVLGSIILKGNRASFHLKARHANQYAIKGCALVGDAAHTLHPLAGQGANLGFLDVASLIDIVVKAKQKGRDYGALNVLTRYERSRRTHNQAMILAMALFKRGFEDQSSLIQRLRNSGLNWVNQQPTVKKIFSQLAMGTLGPIPRLARKT